MTTEAMSLPFPSPAMQWRQVLHRDASADGRFFYAVRSTRIYCRPSCPSRKPLRKNVLFFRTPREAEAAGFRACLRCRPQRVVPEPDSQTRAVARATRYLGRASGDRVPLAEMVRATGSSRLAILRGFRRVLGVTPGQYAQAQRLESFRKALREPKNTITDAIYEAGFGSSSRLYERGTASLGMTPRTMREGGMGMTITYCMADTPLGRMLVAATEIGVCRIAFGKDDQELTADLRSYFPKAELIAANGETGWLAEAVAFVVSQTGESPLAAGFPLDVRATAFQQRVWQALQRIPRGETRSYGELAAALGSPSSTRAVARACGANPVAVAIPCHRVIGKDGSLTGYRWGVERKQALLQAERR